MKQGFRVTPLVGFQSEKAAQIAAYFASLQHEIEKLKLIKLIYLAEREFVGRHGHPMIYDELYSMKDGPICSSALNGINGNLDRETWAKFISLNNREVKPHAEFKRENYDAVSDAELEVLQSIWAKFGHMTSSQIRKWTHENCPEYTEVTQGRVPISYGDIYRSLGETGVDDLEQRINQSRRLDSILSSK